MPVSLKKFYNDKLGKDVDVKTYWFDKTMKPLAVLYGCFAPFTGKEGHGRLLATAAKNGIKDFIVMMPNKDDSNAEGRTMFTNKQKVDIVENIDYDKDNINEVRNGTVLVSDPKKGLYIKTKNGILKVIEIQGENAKRMPIEDFLRGNKIGKFEIFE